jgi:hypothetical protein
MSTRYTLSALAVVLAWLAVHEGRAQNRSARSEVGTGSAASTNRVPRTLDFSDFRIIQDRNIFNPRRYARSSNIERRETPRPARVDTITLTGTMSYEKGTYAFFDGSSSEYRKALKVKDRVGKLQIARIEPKQVVLREGDDNYELPVGYSLRREEGGAWKVSSAPESSTYAAAAVSSAPPNPSPAAVSSSQNTDSSLPIEGLPPPPPGFDPGAMRQVIMELGGPGGPFTPGEGAAGIPVPPPDGNNQNPGAGAGQTQPAQPNAAPAGAGSESDVLRRLMQRREQEMNR